MYWLSIICHPLHQPHCRILYEWRAGVWTTGALSNSHGLFFSLPVFRTNGCPSNCLFTSSELSTRLFGRVAWGYSSESGTCDWFIVQSIDDCEYYISLIVLNKLCVRVSSPVRYNSRIESSPQLNSVALSRFGVLTSCHASGSTE